MISRLISSKQVKNLEAFLQVLAPHAKTNARCLRKHYNSGGRWAKLLLAGEQTSFPEGETNLVCTTWLFCSSE